MSARSIFEVRRRGSSIVAERTVRSKPWRLLLVNLDSAKAVAGGAAERSTEGTLITPAEGSGRVEISLA